MKHITTELEINNKDQVLALFKSDYINSERIGVIGKNNTNFEELCKLMQIDGDLIKTFVFTNLNPDEASGVHTDGPLHHTGLFIPLNDKPITFNWWDVSNNPKNNSTNIGFYDNDIEIILDTNLITISDTVTSLNPVITKVSDFHNVSNNSNDRLFGISIRLVNDKPIDEISVADYEAVFI